MRVARGLPRAKQVALLSHLPALRDELDAAPIFLVKQPEVQSQEGIAKSTLSHVCQYLARHLDRKDLETFLGQLERLDRATGQNLNNPSGQHSALKKILQTFLKKHPQLDAEELFFIFSWARRFLKDEVRRIDRDQSDYQETLKLQPEPTTLTPIQLAMLKAKEAKEKKSNRP